MDAEFAAAQLRSRGIQYLIRSDDAGGMYPSLGVIQLHVAPEDAEKARVILEQPPDAAETPASSMAAENFARPAPPPRVYRFNSGLAAGIVVGLLIHWSYTKYGASREQTYQYDRNGDGVTDLWVHYAKGRAVREKFDDNFDGREDGWADYTADELYSQIEWDTDFNGISDSVTTYSNGLVAQTDWLPNKTNVVLFRQIYRHGALREELRDTNADGRFDVSVGFGAFNNPVETNFLQLPLPSLK